MRDEAMLRKVGDQIAANPDQYYQGAWAMPSLDCGTKCCIAGTAVQLQPDFVAFAMEEDDYRSNVHFVKLAGEDKDRLIQQVAVERLGLTEEEADELFYEDWEPKRSHPTQPLHEAVRDALYALADGASIEDVSQELRFSSDDDWDA